METALNARVVRTVLGAALIILSVSYGGVAAQSQLPAPSRTIYKCMVKGRVSYSDVPCMGAQRLDVVPTRGVDRLSGSTRRGKDVTREIHAEQFAEAIYPLSGMSAPELATAVRRNRMAPAVRRECYQLESTILRFELVEKRSDAATRKLLEPELFTLRKRYKHLAC